MNTNDYPAEYIASDQASIRIQRNYFRLLKAELVLFVSASFVGILTAFAKPPFDRPLAIAAAILIVTGFLVMWWMRRERFEQKWFRCRAVSESIKTTTWRYMMQAPPFDLALENGDSDPTFIDTLMAIRRDRSGTVTQQGAPNSGAGQITEFMRTTRRLPLEQRKAFYISDRLRDQEHWYQGKSAQNRRSAANWSNLIFTTQAAAIALAVLRVAYPRVPISPVSFLMTGASSMLAWTQARRQGDLVEPYAVAAKELRELEALSGKATDPDSFGRFVSDVEETISREHTKWLARRSI